MMLLLNDSSKRESDRISSLIYSYFLGMFGAPFGLLRVSHLLIGSSLVRDQVRASLFYSASLWLVSFILLSLFHMEKSHVSVSGSGSRFDSKKDFFLFYYFIVGVHDGVVEDLSGFIKTVESHQVERYHSHLHSH